MADIPTGIRESFKKIFVTAVICHVGTWEDPWTREKPEMVDVCQKLWNNIFPSKPYRFNGDKDDDIYRLVSLLSLYNILSL